MRKFLAAVLAAAMTLSLAATSFAAEKKTETAAKEKPAQSQSAQDWVMSQLSRNSQAIYKAMLEDLRAMKTTVTVSYKGSAKNALSEFGEIVKLLKKEHPELFWISYDNQFARAKNGTLTWAPKYYPQYLSGGKLDKNLVKQAQAKIDKAASSVGKGKSIYESVKLFNSYLTSNVKYYLNRSDYDIYELTGSLGNGIAVCEGFAKGLKYLCDQAGIDCLVVSGSGILSGKNYPAHEWCYVKMDDGKWYLVDPTWNSLQGQGTEKWFLLGSGSALDGLALLKSHAPDGTHYPTLSKTDYQPA